MRPMRTAAAALIGAMALTGLTAPLAIARDGAASGGPSQAAPGHNVTGPDSGPGKGPDGGSDRGSGKGSDKGPDKGLGDWGKAAGEWAGSLGQSGAGNQQVAPHGSVHTGLGGSVAGNPAELAGGLALVAGGVGGFWLLRRRGA
ncbi:hypothetical protein ACWCXH_09280 [Kitasatospora sp. NPDC001660]